MRPYILLILATLTLISAAQSQPADSLCALSIVENRPFMAFANSRIPVALKKSTGNEILYLIFTKQTGEYTGISLQLDDSYKVMRAVKFSFGKGGYIANPHNWPSDSLNLKTLFADGACYMNDYYKAEGTDVLLLCRNNSTPVNGLVYKGCSLSDPYKETTVHNKTWLALLDRLRKNF